MEITITREEYREMIRAQIALEIIARKVEESDGTYINTSDLEGVLSTWKEGVRHD
jgi:hypothetical protein